MPWKLPDSDDQLLALAKLYPYNAPPGSYLFIDGGSRPISRGAIDAAAYEARVPVIAHGSNRSPEQLARKFGTGAAIPVSRGWLNGYDVVYSAHITRYGAVATNLRHIPGMQVEIWITWLTERQLLRMHETELGTEIYRYGELTGVEIALDAGPAETIRGAGVYLSRNGYLAADGAAVGLAAVPANGRPHDSLHQEEALTLVRDRHHPDQELDMMILTLIREPDRRRALIDQMRAHALPPEAPHFEDAGL